MHKFAPFAISLISLAVLPVACGSSKDSQIDGTGTAAGSGSGPPNIVVGGNADGGPGLNGNHDGGLVQLTPAQVAGITQAACTGWTTEGENLPAAIELVIDTSGSMDDPAPGSRNSKWVVTRDALISAIAGLPASVSLGALYFPNEDTGNSTAARATSACVNTRTMVPIAVLG